MSKNAQSTNILNTERDPLTTTEQDLNALKQLSVTPYAHPAVE